MKFKGDIIITDPCYIDTKDNKMWSDNSIDLSNGSGLRKYGFTDYIWESTIYGDWSCSYFDQFIEWLENYSNYNHWR